MAENLFPVFDIPLVDNTQNQVEEKYPFSPLFDITTGEFLTDGNGKIALGSGYDSFVIWCTKTILTCRFAHYAYSENIGIERDRAFKEPDRKAAESAFERTIVEALLADPLKRTLEVRDFKFNWGADSLEISCQVSGENGITAEITTTINN